MVLDAFRYALAIVALPTSLTETCFTEEAIRARIKIQYMLIKSENHRSGD